LFDNQIYAYGKGASATTVSAPQSGASVGSVVTITGTVIDNTPSGKDKGTPAIGDASMDAWMEHLYHQRPIPSNATGVPVSLDTIDPNGNLVHIGDVTSDMNGNYGLPYTPQIPGTYQIIATFHGSKAYGSSSDTTYLAVGEAAPTASPYPIVNIPSTEMYTIGVGIAVIIAIAIGFAVTILTLRKRP
jgi:hypothetical protein